ncbi:mannitol dehydrogenase family protein [Phaeobacter sp. HF9A]|uniref:mannitol dehydrogenase family protein n=1 Tax=Phaeobacter sp. HF9A TaxID=2721561 RepID=UPI00143025A7|nr:mannitol dehydrogenase family protein [Phaeobacter sp. HF9A]NIZ12314.1 mannitol dehydrogenase family protein [Phaeobacter sp. HF9A]
MEAGLPDNRLTRTEPAPKTGIVHLGLGAFFRGHGAIYTEEAIAASGGDWGIIGVSLQTPRMRDALEPQGGTYMAVELGPKPVPPRHVQVIDRVLVAPEDPQAVLDVMTDPAIRIVSLTVTEKGYCHEPASGALNLTHPDIQHDIANPLPRSAPGFLVRALQARRAAGHAPFTVQSCDNLPDNGRVARGVVLALAREIDPALADWIGDEGRFPAAMVDRIVPATKPEDITALREASGTYDAAPVMHEPFRQWVIEDDFVGGARPDWAAVGAQMVEDIAAYEHMKLCMLNGTHSSLAYLGYLAGKDTIADTMADPAFAAFVDHLWRAEIAPGLTPPEGVSLADYAAALAERYRNPAIRHLTWQIAMDGSQKLPQRILGTVGEAMAAGRPCPGLILAIAAWMRYVGGVDEAGNPIDVRDPFSAELKALSDSAEAPDAKVAALLSLRAVFSAEQAAALLAPVSKAYATLVEKGAKRALAEILS